MEAMNRISIARDFSDTPGGRYRKDGEFSGEEFRDRLLRPAFEALEEHQKLTIDLDGAYGYPVSFLEEAFGGLAREFGSRLVLNKLDFVCYDEPSLIDQIRGHIRDAR